MWKVEMLNVRQHQRRLKQTKCQLERAELAEQTSLASAREAKQQVKQMPARPDSVHQDTCNYSTVLVGSSEAKIVPACLRPVLARFEYRACISLGIESFSVGSTIIQCTMYVKEWYQHVGQLQCNNVQ